MSSWDPVYPDRLMTIWEPHDILASHGPPGARQLNDDLNSFASVHRLCWPLLSVRLNRHV